MLYLITDLNTYSIEVQVYRIIDKAVASGLASPVLAGSLSAIGNFAKDRDTLIEQSVWHSDRTVNATPPIEQQTVNNLTVFSQNCCQTLKNFQ